MLNPEALDSGFWRGITGRRRSAGRSAGCVAVLTGFLGVQQFSYTLNLLTKWNKWGGTAVLGQFYVLYRAGSSWFGLLSV